MKSLNRVTLLGNVGKDPEIRTTQTNKNVAKISIATTESYKDSNGEWKEITDWHNVIFWDKKADVCANFLKKGSKVMIEGKLKTRSYEKDGKKLYITEVQGSEIFLLDNKGDVKDIVNEYSNEPEEQDDSVPF